MSTIYLVSCAQPDGSVGSSVGVDRGGEIAVDTFDVEVDTSVSTGSTKTGSSPYLFVGRALGMTGHAIMRFNRPTLPDDWALNSTYAVVRYMVEDGLGDAPYSADFELRMLDLNWSESNPPDTAALPGSVIDEAPIFAGENPVGDNPREYTTRIYDEWIREWLLWDNPMDEVDTAWTDTTRNDSALTLWITGTGSAERLMRFYSRNASPDSLTPKLYLHGYSPDSAGVLQPDTLIVNAGGDLFFVTDEGTVPQNRLVVGSGAVYESYLKFDLSSLWEHAATHYLVVNRAVVTLHRDSTAFPLIPATKSLWQYKLADDLWTTDPDSVNETGITVIPTAIDTTQATVNLTVTYPATEWIRGAVDNHGISIHSGAEGLDIDRVAFYSGEAADPVVRPRLTIYYTRMQR